MMPRLPRCTILALAGAVLLPLPAAAQSVDFGDDSSIWALDEECDDPRFIGEGMAPGALDSNILADATDCAAAFDAGTITLDPAFADAEVPANRPAKPGTATVAAAGEIDFGADTSEWANDGECDDPRFAGEGMAPQPQDVDMMADASDCRALYDAGSIDLIASAPALTGIDFGDDSSNWANDGVCDDPRFVGEGMASVLQDSDILADATDCQALFDSGAIALAANASGDPGATDPVSDEVDFGADTGQWINDGECDDPRFEGEGMAEILVEADLFADATDCRTLYEAGMIEFVGDATNAAEIDFGTDTGKWAGDGECDDPRFIGEGMAASPLDALRYLDASDCRSLYEAGQLSYLGE
jgi:hypothetical protein